MAIITITSKFDSKCDKCKILLKQGSVVFYHTERRRAKCHPRCPEPEIELKGKRHDTLELLRNWKSWKTSYNKLPLEERAPF